MGAYQAQRHHARRAAIILREEREALVQASLGLLHVRNQVLNIDARVGDGPRPASQPVVLHAAQLQTKLARVASGDVTGWQERVKPEVSCDSCRACASLF